MKIELGELEKLYREALLSERDGKTEITVDEAVAVLVSVRGGVEGSLENIVQELSADPKFLHGMYGKPEAIEWQQYKTVGDSSYHPNINSRFRDTKKFKEAEELEKKAKTEEAKERVSKKDGWLLRVSNLHNGCAKRSKEADLLKSYCGPEIWSREDTRGRNFEADVHGFDVEGSYVFVMTYPDNTHDDRIRVSVSYGLAVPPGEEETVRCIKDNPGLLIDVFRKVYPGYDNSEGKLRIVKTDFK